MIAARLRTAPRTRGAIAVVSLTADSDELDSFLRSHRIDTPVGAVRLRSLLGIDGGLVARWSDTSCDLMPHGGPLIVRRLMGALERAGASLDLQSEASLSPEARSPLEGLVLRAIAEAQSPLATDVLLRQRARWSGVLADPPPHELADADALNRLIRPPLVATVGAPNIGKSTLLNAICRHRVSLTADAEGVTRDHVGAAVEVEGLVVHWVDTPGLGGGRHAVDAAAISAAESLARSCDLLILCADHAHRFPEWPPSAGQLLLRLGLRGDLGAVDGADLMVAAETGDGLGALAATVRERLVPASAIADSRPWAFWGAISSTDPFGKRPPRV